MQSFLEQILSLYMRLLFQKGFGVVRLNKHKNVFFVGNSKEIEDIQMFGVNMTFFYYIHPFDRRDANLAMTFMLCLVTLDMTSETRIGLYTIK